MWLTTCSAAIIYFLKSIILFFNLKCLFLLFWRKIFLSPFFSSENHFYSIICFSYSLFILLKLQNFGQFIFLWYVSRIDVFGISNNRSPRSASYFPPSSKLMFSVGISMSCDVVPVSNFKLNMNTE